jgi:hypothetical protein
MYASRRWAALAVVAVFAVPIAVQAAPTTGVGGTAGKLELKTGGRVDTPSGKFLKLASRTFTGSSGPVLVRFSGEGSDLDSNAQAVFVGRSYAAMEVRVLLNGVPMAPGSITFLDNSGTIAVKKPHPAVASFEWAGTLSTGRRQTVTVQWRNLHTWDSATILRWTLAIQHA